MHPKLQLHIDQLRQDIPLAIENYPQAKHTFIMLMSVLDDLETEIHKKYGKPAD